MGSTSSSRVAMLASRSTRVGAALTVARASRPPGVAAAAAAGGAGGTAGCRDGGAAAAAGGGGGAGSVSIGNRAACAASSGFGCAGGGRSLTHSLQSTSDIGSHCNNVHDGTHLRGASRRHSFSWSPVWRPLSSASRIDQRAKEMQSQGAMAAHQHNQEPGV